MKDWLAERLPLLGGLPSHDTLEEFLAALKPDAFQSCFQSWRERICAAHDKPDTNVIAIDGKTCVVRMIKLKGWVQYTW